MNPQEALTVLDNVSQQIACAWVAFVDLASWFIHSGVWYGPAGLVLCLLTVWSAREWYRWVQMEDVGA